jgi:L-threonylcarbamoyladenylate synthase
MEWTDQQKQEWVSALEAGDVVAAPAEGVYGYCCDPFNAQALENLLTLKRRDGNKGLIVLIPSILEIGQLCPPFQDEMLFSIYDHWGVEDGMPTTLILPARANVLPEKLTGGRDTIAVRCPDVGYMQEYLQVWDRPLVSTSLNMSGEDPAVDAEDIPEGITALTLAEPLNGKPSRIYDVVSGIWVRK